jgi:hypothetical protein
MNPSNTLPISVDNTGFMLEKMAQDCSPLQFLRELTKNSVQAILRTAGHSGDILWE